MHVMFIPSWYDNNRNKVHGSFFREQATKLQESGVKVTVAYNEIWPLTLTGKVKEKSGLSFNVEKGLRTYRYKNYNFIPKHPLMFNIFDKRMEKLYKEVVKKEGKVDVIHAQSSLWGGISAAYIAKKYNIPLIITEHSSVKRGKYVRESYYKRIIDSYKSADTIIAVGNGLKKEIEELTNRKDIKVIGNLVDLSLFDIRDIKRESDEFIFFSVAFLEGEKGFDTLIKAFSKKFKNEKVRLVIGGDGSQRAWLEGIAKSECIENQITFTGALSREEVASWMNKCNAFVLPSRYETFGVVYIEALASGKPVIGTFNGGAEDIVTKDVGILIEIDNIKDLSNAMDYIRKNNKEYEAYKLRKYCTENFSANVIVKKIINVYKEVLK
ncbi:glycosyltransferase [uncultured Clostridium sp.]|uniref:glycosyltransferase n=1 Tax=uncultured Clostridium sp. TaxID=59620 RepID=UPI0025F8A309|nr:glycosyltransferase [uncultured Clostridium sp.]MDU4882885.1 glycosyltransferase [Clostridium celatum]MDU7075753.1 glycosyltransferase [Clostridium celatum]